MISLFPVPSPSKFSDLSSLQKAPREFAELALQGNESTAWDNRKTRIKMFVLFNFLFYL